MIIFENVQVVVDRKEILSSAFVRIPSDRRIAILAESAKNTKILINLLAGVLLPRAGHIIRNASVSFPPGHLGGFAPDLSVRLNVAHVARLYGADVDAVVNFVASAGGFKRAFERPFRALAKPAKVELSQILALTIPFDVYLFENISPPGHRGFNKKIYALFQARARTSGIIIGTRQPDVVRQFCDMAIIQRGGQLRLLDDVEKALARFAKDSRSKRGEALFPNGKKPRK
jgi:capsular polysaccharide transport system ATP-binding protein